MDFTVFRKKLVTTFENKTRIEMKPFQVDGLSLVTILEQTRYCYQRTMSPLDKWRFDRDSAKTFLIARSFTDFLDSFRKKA
jgi:hypothetical protein